MRVHFFIEKEGKRVREEIAQKALAVWGELRPHDCYKKESPNRRWDAW